MLITRLFKGMQKRNGEYIYQDINKLILEYKEKTIIQLVEDIRLYLMDRIIKNKNRVMRYKGPLCPKIQDILEFNKFKSNL